MIEKRSFKLAWLFLKRAMLLRCPLCGTKPLFMAMWKTRNLRDWFTPLDGCPRCGYPYEREPGYYLMSIWAVNYGFGSILGITIYLLCIWLMDLSLLQLLLVVLLPVIAFNFAFARHSKSLFLAMDLFFDPHERWGGNDGGNRPAQKPPSSGAPRAGEPLPPAPLPVTTGTHTCKN